jgi:hypothetical protein
MQQNITLLSAASATGSAVSLQLGGEYCFDAAGTFGGCTVGLQMLGADGTTWLSIRDADGAIGLTEARAVFVTLPAGSYRATITGGSGVSMNARLRNV